MTSGNRARAVEIVIGCDTDPDREALVGPLRGHQLTWNGVTEGIPALKESVAHLRDSHGRAPAFTWLLRADEQLRAYTGDYAWVVEGHRDLLRTLAASGDELGWHPHFWRAAPNGAWYQEVEDTAWQLEMLREAHGALARSLPAPPRSVRMGWNYHSTATFNALDALGLRVDFSALPGMRTYRGTPPTRSENLFDWRTAPRHPYRAATADHRRAAGAGEPASRLIELPIFVADSRLWSLVAGAQLARKTRALTPIGDAVARPTYWINLTARPGLFAPLVAALGRAIRRATGSPHGPMTFATYFHPDELIPNRTALYAMAHVRENLRALVDICGTCGADVAFRTAAEVAERLVASPSSLRHDLP